ncbi:MAG: hypothetical protein QM778_25475 [Myxococcales bacterium]
MATAGVLAACHPPTPPTAPLPTHGALAQRDRSCQRYSVQVSGPYHQELAEPVDDPLLDVMPPEARRSARAAGLEPLILALFQARSAPAPDLTRILTLQQRLFTQLVSFDSQLQSLLTEVDCTDDVVEDLSAQLSQRQDNRELRLTLASIVVAAAAGIAAGAWEIASERSTGSSLVAVLGGAGSAGFGVAALVPKQHTVPYLHPHNLLAPIASGHDDDRIYPTFVRRLLSTPPGPNQPSPREDLLHSFDEKIAKTYPSSEHERVRQLLYGTGAVYDQTLIDLRESMYDALEAKLSAFAREFELLNRYLVNVTGADVASDAGVP